MRGIGKIENNMKKKSKDITERFMERKFFIVLPFRWPLQVRLYHLHIYVWRVTNSHDPNTCDFLCALSFHTIITGRECDLSPFLCIWTYYCYPPTTFPPPSNEKLITLLKANYVCCCELKNMELSWILHLRHRTVNLFYTRTWHIHTFRVRIRWWASGLHGNG